MAVKRTQLLALPAEERLELLALLWDCIAECPEALDLTPAEKRALDRRLATYARDPEAGGSWTELRERIRASR